MFSFSPLSKGAKARTSFRFVVFSPSFEAASPIIIAVK